MAKPQTPCLIVVGTRPEAIKVLPVILALRDSESIRPVVVSTGQHEDLVNDVLRLAGVEPDVDLAVARPEQTLNGVTYRVVRAIEDLLKELRGGVAERRGRPRLQGAVEGGEGAFPGFTLVHGDTTSAMAAGLASANARLPVFHLEAGLRSNNMLMPFPEELNRRVLTTLSSFHIAPTLDNKESLIREGISGELIFVSGNTGIDALQWAANLQAPWPDARLEGVDDGRPLLVVTAHRRENWGGGLAGIAEGVARVCRARPDLTAVLPLHPNPRVAHEMRPILDPLPNVIITEPLDYAVFARLLKAATLAISDSGGIQEEGPSVGTPDTLTLVCPSSGVFVVWGGLRCVGRLRSRNDWTGCVVASGVGGRVCRGCVGGRFDRPGGGGGTGGSDRHRQNRLCARTRGGLPGRGPEVDVYTSW